MLKEFMNNQPSYSAIITTTLLAVILGACSGGGGGGGGGSTNDTVDSWDSGNTDSDQSSNTTPVIYASNAEFDDGFGWDLDLSRDGSTLIAAARFESSGASGVNGDQSDNSAEWAGAAYIFVRGEDAWTQQAYLKYINAQQHDYFGWWGLTLSADGSTAAVSANNVDSPTSGNPTNPSGLIGSVSVYTRTDNEWSFQQEIRHPDWLQPGNSLALSDDGNTLAISDTAPCNGIASSTAFFATPVYIYTRSGTQWSEQTCISIDANPDNTIVEELFDSVDISGDGNTLVVGVTSDPSASRVIYGDESDTSAPFAGSAYVFVRSGNSWTQQAYLKASNADANDRFGATVSISRDGNYIAVGAGKEASNAVGINGNQNNNSASNAGAVYIFNRSEGLWTQQAYIKASDTVSNGYFGADNDESGGVHLNNDGSRLVVIAVGQNPGFYKFGRTDTTWTQLHNEPFTSESSTSFYGTDSALSGDGETIIIGDPFADTESVQTAGAVFIYE
ncbi:MAG: FG-GAP repeat protein [Candidatus Thiodiazotropha taylori]